MAEHTALPWALESVPNLEDGENIEILDSDGFPIAKIEGWPIINKWSERFPAMQHWADGADDGRTQRERTAAEILANARLLLAAPDLLAACQQLENALAFALTGHPLPNTATIIEAAQAAIVKAGGWMGIDPADQP